MNDEEVALVELERRLASSPRVPMDLAMLSIKRRLAARVSPKEGADHEWEYVRGLADLDIDDDECIGAVVAEDGRKVLALELATIERWLRDAVLNRPLDETIANWKARGYLAAERKGIAFGSRVVPCCLIWAEVLIGGN